MIEEVEDHNDAIFCEDEDHLIIHLTLNPSAKEAVANGTVSIQDLKYLFISLQEANFSFGAATFGDDILVLRSSSSCFAEECEHIHSNRKYTWKILKLIGGVLAVAVFFILLAFFLAVL